MSSEIDQLAETRMILIGKTGNGKSSTGNSLLRKEAFRQKKSPNAVTNKCELKTATDITNTVLYTVVDTPGLFDTSVSLAERALEIQKSVEICKKPHAFLIVFSAKNRMTEEEKYTIDMLRIIFGENVFKYMIVVFTHGDIFPSDIEFKHFWTENEEFVNLIKRCGNRVTRIENKEGLDVYNENEDARQIFKMITEMAEKQNGVYDYKHLKTHKEVIEKHAISYSGTGNIHDEVSEMVKELGKKLDGMVWKAILYGGVVAGAFAIAGAGVGVAVGGAMAETATVASVGAIMMNNAAAVGGAIARTAGAAANAAAGTRIGTVVLNNGASVGGAVVRSAWNVVTKIKFW